MPNIIILETMESMTYEAEKVYWAGRFRLLGEVYEVLWKNFNSFKFFYRLATSDGKKESLNSSSGGNCRTNRMKLKFYVCTSKAGKSPLKLSRRSPLVWKKEKKRADLLCHNCFRGHKINWSHHRKGTMIEVLTTNEAKMTLHYFRLNSLHVYGSQIIDFTKSLRVFTDTCKDK